MKAIEPMSANNYAPSGAAATRTRKGAALISTLLAVMGCAANTSDAQGAGGAPPLVPVASGGAQTPAVIAPSPSQPPTEPTAVPAVSADPVNAGGAPDSSPGPTDASTPSSAGCPGNADLLCEDWENGVIDPERWLGAGPGIVVEEGKAAHGRYALHVTGSQASSNVVLTHVASFAQPRDAIFLRAYVWMAPPLPPRNWNYLVLNGDGVMWRMGGTTTPFGEEGGQRTIRVMHLPLHKIVDTEIPFPTERWMCWELELRREGKILNVWIDGAPAPAASLPANAGNEPFVFPVFQSLEIGINHPHPEPAVPEVWLDDVALGTSRIGCVTP